MIRLLPIAMLACALLLGGCASAPERVAAGPDAQCVEAYQRVDEAVSQAGVQDGMAARVAGCPYLRVNRFLASYSDDELDDGRFAEWMDRMIALGTQAHAIELANLPKERAEVLGHALWSIDRRLAWPGPALAECSARLAAADRADPARRAALRAAARVPDDYLTWQRVVGLYWLTRIPFASGVSRWQRSVREEYSVPLEALTTVGELRGYAPPAGRLSAAAAGALMKRVSANALGIPDPVGDDLDAMFRTYAPDFAVDTAGDADLPGELGLRDDGAPAVVSRLPTVYRRSSHARYGGRALLQLSYWIWFPERPLTGSWDLLGGHLDSVIWRVTLKPDGTPWVYDTIHGCGCYHLFFPTALATVRAQPDTIDETVFVPQALPRIEAGARVTLRLETGTHYVRRVVLGAAPGGPAREYVLAEDDSLRSLAFPGGGRRSAFRPDGIVAGSERGERWLFWPMGVPSAGAMRQWGRHATAFVGRRHFDDAGLMEQYFLMKD